MVKRYLIGIDLGTTGCRSAVFDDKLRILGEAYNEYGLIHISGTQIEQDANLWWKLTKKVIIESIKKSKVDAQMIKAIGVSSQGISIVPVDMNCNPLRNAISWLDTRAVRETKSITDKYDSYDIYNVTGKRINEAYTLPKLIWIKAYEPHIYDNAYKFLMPHDFLIAKLSGEYVTDHTMASGTLMYDVRQRRWYEKILNDFGIDMEKLPRLKNSAESPGKILTGVAAELGLPNDVIVTVGGQDQKCAAFGAGINENICTVSLGTATAVEKLHLNPLIDRNMRIPFFSYLYDKQWVAEGVIGTSCAGLKWFRNTLFADKKYSELDEMARTIEKPGGTVFFYPYLNGTGSPYWYKNAQGCFFGINLSTSANELVKSVLEGIAFQIKSNLNVMEEDSVSSKELRVFGGGAVSDVWCGLIADITEKNVSTLFTHETACMGAAGLAGIGSGVYSGWSDVHKTIRVKRVFACDKFKFEEYEQKYQAYIDMQNKMMS